MRSKCRAILPADAKRTPAVVQTPKFGRLKDSTAVDVCPKTSPKTTLRHAEYVVLNMISLFFVSFLCFDFCTPFFVSKRCPRC